MDFLGFIEQIWKENNTYFIGLLIIENVELLNLKGFCGESVLYRGKLDLSSSRCLVIKS